MDGFLPNGQLKTRLAADGSTQTVAKGQDIPGEWWVLFKSAHLNGLVQRGLEFNADLKAAEAAVRVAQANALVQRGALFPVVAGNYNLTSEKFPTQSTTTRTW